MVSNAYAYINLAYLLIGKKGKEIEWLILAEKLKKLNWKLEMPNYKTEFKNHLNNWRS